MDTSQSPGSPEGGPPQGQPGNAQPQSIDTGTSFMLPASPRGSTATQAPRKRTGSTIARILVSLVLVAVALAIGGGIFNTLAALKKPPQKSETPQTGPLVRTVEVRRGDHAEDVTGFGPVVAPVRATVAARVSGTVLNIAPEMQEGLIAQPGKTLIQIDPEPFQKALDVSAAQASEAKTRIDSLPTQEKHLKERIALAEQSVMVAKAQHEKSRAGVPVARRSREVAASGVETARSNLSIGRDRLKRLDELHAKGDVSKDTVDAQRVTVGQLESAVVAADAQLAAADIGVHNAESAVIGAESAVKAAENAALALRLELDNIPDTRKQLEAAHASALAAMAGAQLSIDHCKVEAPFADAKIRKLYVRPRDSVMQGAPLFIAAGGDSVEIEARLPASKRADIALGAEAVVRDGPGGKLLARASIDRLSPSIDEASRTFIAYVTVSEKNIAGERRALVPGEMLFVETKGRVHKNVFIVPRLAEVDGSIFAVRDGHAVRVTPPAVSVTRSGELLLIEDNADGQGRLAAGDSIIVSNLDSLADGSPVRTGGNGANGAARSPAPGNGTASKPSDAAGGGGQ